MQIAEPTLIINEERCRTNIQNMVQKAYSNNLLLRPHFKTHQSIKVGEWYRGAGVTHITVSSLRMANYFADAGWQHILIAFPTNILQIEGIDQLASRVNLDLLLDSQEVADVLDEGLSNKVGVFIELDTGSHRSGLPTNDAEAVLALAKYISGKANLNFKGCYSHAGHTYSARSKSQIAKIADKSLAGFLNVKQYLFNHFDTLEFCWGDTPSCSILEKFEALDAISPGNFVFYDAMQVAIGSCIYDDVSVAMKCPVVSKNEEREEVCIYGGAVHFSKDSLKKDDGSLLFGVVVDENWQPVEDSYVKSLSQEHGIVKLAPPIYYNTKIGDVLTILPIHSCLTAQAMGAFKTVGGEDIDHLTAQKNRDLG